MQPLEERRRLLADLFDGRNAAAAAFAATRRQPRTRDVDQLFAEARERGNEGLLLKRSGSPTNPASAAAHGRNSSGPTAHWMS